MKGNTRAWRAREEMASQTGTAPSTRGKKRDGAILRGVGASVAVRIMNAIVAVVTLGIAAKALTKEEFGLVAALFSLSMILMLFDLGVGGSLVTRVAAAHARADLDEMRACVGEALLALTALGALFAAVGTTSALVLPWDSWLGGGTLDPAAVRSSVIVVFVSCGAALPAGIGVMTLTGQQRLASAQLVIAVRGVVTLMATACVAYAGLGPWAFLLAFVGVPTLVAGVLTAWILMRELGGVMKRAGFVLHRITSTFRDSVYFAICNISNAVAFGTGTIIVASVLGPGEAGTFGVASRMFALVASTVAASGSQLWPAMTEAITRGDVGWARRRYRHGILIVGAVTSAVCLVLVLFGQPIARVWVGSDLVPSLSLLVWTAAFTIVAAVSIQASMLLRAVDRMQALAALCVVNAVVSVIASVLLTQSMGVSGGAVGALVACLALFLPGVAMLARRVLKNLGSN